MAARNRANSHLRHFQQGVNQLSPSPGRLACLSSLLKNAIVAFFNLAKRLAKLRTAHKITTYVAILSSHP